MLEVSGTFHSVSESLPGGQWFSPNCPCSAPCVLHRFPYVFAGFCRIFAGLPTGFPRPGSNICGFREAEAKHETETSKLVEVALSEALQAVAEWLSGASMKPTPDPSGSIR